MDPFDTPTGRYVDNRVGSILTRKYDVEKTGGKYQYTQEEQKWLNIYDQIIQQDKIPQEAEDMYYAKN